MRKRFYKNSHIKKTKNCVRTICFITEKNSYTTSRKYEKSHNKTRFETNVQEFHLKLIIFFSSPFE